MLCRIVTFSMTLIRFSRSRHFWSRISQKNLIFWKMPPHLLGTKLLINTNQTITIYNLSHGITFNDLDCPLTGISRSRYFSTLNISETIRDRDIVTIEHEYEVNRLSIEWWYLQWPSRTPNPVLKVTTFFEVEYLKNCASYGQRYYSTLIGNHT